MKIWTRQWHVEYGRHSGIPECCIEHFVECWERGLMFEGYDSGVDYVRCPRCVATDNRVEVHACSPECSFQRMIDAYWGLSNEDRRKGKRWVQLQLDAYREV